jgi:hypothetical protein
MPKYLITPQITSFGCAAGSIVADEQGVADVDNPDVVAALIAHGFTLTEIEAPTITEGEETPPEQPAETQPAVRTGRKNNQQKAEAPASDEAQLDAALNTAIGQG